MDMKIEAMIESLISQGKVSREEVENKINEYKKTSPVTDLNNIGDIEFLQMEMIDQLGMMVSMLMEQVATLETKVSDLEVIVNA